MMEHIRRLQMFKDKWLMNQFRLILLITSICASFLLEDHTILFNEFFLSMILWFVVDMIDNKDERKLYKDVFMFLYDLVLDTYELLITMPKASTKHTGKIRVASVLRFLIIGGYLFVLIFDITEFKPIAERICFLTWFWWLLEVA